MEDDTTNSEDSFQSSFARALAQASVRREKRASNNNNNAEDLQLVLHESKHNDNSALCNNTESSWQLKEECQRLLEENRRLRAATIASPVHNAHEQRAEIALLQSRVNTLNWQLSQSESNRRVLRTVSDQVVTFLDRVNSAMTALEKQRSPPKSGSRVPRSRSTHESRRQSGTSMDTSRTSDVDDEFVPRSSLLRSGSDAISPQPPAWRRSRMSVLEEESTNPGRLGQQARRLARTMRSLLTTQDKEIKPASLPEIQTDALDTCSLSDILRSSRRRLSYDNNRDQQRSAFLQQQLTGNNNVYHETTTIIDKYVTTPALSISTSSDSCSDHSSSPTRKQETDESGFSSLGSFQEIGIPTYPQNGLPVTHVRCRSSPAAAVTATKRSFYRRNVDNSAEIATLEKLEVLWV